MKFSYTTTGNWENAFRGLRHPLESYAKSDSIFSFTGDVELDDGYCDEVVNSYVENWKDERTDPNKEEIKEWLWHNGNIETGDHAFQSAYIGSNDLDLAQRMIKAGSPNDKFLRQIFVSVDITGPLYWWKELDTYKVGTVANSTSTMHKLATTPITIDCFETDDYDGSVLLDNKYGLNFMEDELIPVLESLRLKYLETKDKRYWKELIRWLPEGWMQTRTFTCNYAVLRNIIHWRQGHKLTEWASFIDWCRSLPYAEELLFYAQ